MANKKSQSTTEEMVEEIRQYYTENAKDASFAILSLREFLSKYENQSLPALFFACLINLIETSKHMRMEEDALLETCKAFHHMYGQAELTAVDVAPFRFHHPQYLN